MNLLNKSLTLALSFALGGMAITPTATQACSRVLYTGDQNTVITGRSMDWMEDMATDLWVFPRGIARTGLAGTNSAQWTSKYGSVVSSVYGIATADGMNEKGLVMNMLYLTESDYGTSAPGHPAMSISLWGQYALDNFATVSDAVTAMENAPFYLIPPTLPNGKKGQVHLSLSDATGDSAIIEFVDGKQVIHHGKEFTVMTNSPTYSKQLALNEYWQEIGGTVFLPGTSRAADRFARASFFVNAVPKALDKSYIQGVPDHSYAYQAVAGVMSIMRSVSVPLGITTPNQPNIASTIWRTVSDQKNRVYYFDSATRPNTFWVSLGKLDFNQNAPVKKLPLAQGQVYSGEVADKFVSSPALHFIPAPQTGKSD